MPQGRARVSTRHPQAKGECDRCSGWHNLKDMRRQYQWAGNKLVDTGLLVGADCYDIPQDQYRSIILPPDPRPVPNPRPSPNVTAIPTIGQPLFNSPENQGFTQFVVGGATTYPYYPTTKYDVLRMVADLSGVPVPPQIIDRSVNLSAPNRSFPLMGTQPTRGWMLIYNPTNPQAQVNLTIASPLRYLMDEAGNILTDETGAPMFDEGAIARTRIVTLAEASVTWGVRTNLILGPGEAYFAATDQGLGPCYTGALAAIGLIPGEDFWAWESAGQEVMWLTDDFGNLITDDYGQAIPIDAGQVAPALYNNGGVLSLDGVLGWPTLQPAGPSMWSNGGVVSVGPNVTENFDAAPLFFATVTAFQMRLLAGGDLPWRQPRPRSGQLWNPGGASGGDVWVA